jgi:hypothetical protein
MGYGDYIPLSGHHQKKPLTKAQLKKLEQNYQAAEKMHQESKKKEQEEQITTTKLIEQELNIL